MQAPNKKLKMSKAEIVMGAQSLLQERDKLEQGIRIVSFEFNKAIEERRARRSAVLKALKEEAAKDEKLLDKAIKMAFESWCSDVDHDTFTVKASCARLEEQFMLLQREIKIRKSEVEGIDKLYGKLTKL